MNININIDQIDLKQLERINDNVRWTQVPAMESLFRSNNDCAILYIAHMHYEDKHIERLRRCMRYAIKYMNMRVFKYTFALLTSLQENPDIEIALEVLFFAEPKYWNMNFVGFMVDKFPTYVGRYVCVNYDRTYNSDTIPAFRLLLENTTIANLLTHRKNLNAVYWMLYPKHRQGCRVKFQDVIHAIRHHPEMISSFKYTRIPIPKSKPYVEEVEN